MAPRNSPSPEAHIPPGRQNHWQHFLYLWYIFRKLTQFIWSPQHTGHLSVFFPSCRLNLKFSLSEYRNLKFQLYPPAFPCLSLPTNMFSSSGSSTNSNLISTTTKNKDRHQKLFHNTSRFILSFVDLDIDSQQFFSRLLGFSTLTMRRCNLKTNEWTSILLMRKKCFWFKLNRII